MSDPAKQKYADNILIQRQILDGTNMPVDAAARTAIQEWFFSKKAKVYIAHEMGWKRPNAQQQTTQNYAAAIANTDTRIISPQVVDNMRHWIDYMHAALTNTDYPEHLKLTAQQLQSSAGAAIAERVRLWDAWQKKEAKLVALGNLQEGIDYTIIAGLDLPDNMFLVELTSIAALKAEGAQMGHCIAGYHDRINGQDGLRQYSLWDQDGAPHCTFELKNTTLQQCQGKENKPPVAKYAPAVTAAIQQMGWGLGTTSFKKTGLIADRYGKAHSIYNLPVPFDGDLSQLWWWAINDNRAEMVAQLIAAKADVNTTNNDGYTALISSSARGHTEVVAQLIAADADVDTQNKVGDTALILAANSGHTEIVVQLIAADADVNTTNNNSATALAGPAAQGHTKIVEKLIEAGVDINAHYMYGNTALIYAAVKRHTDIVDKLIAAGADVNLQNNNHNTALKLTAWHGHTEIVEKLIAAKADINVQNDSRDTALMNAAKKGHTEIVVQLIDAGADVNVQGEDGNTALIWATQKGHAEIVEKLVAAGADVNVKNDLNDTALIITANIGYPQIAAQLLAAGADTNVREKYGNTALSLANTRRHTEVADLITQAIEGRMKKSTTFGMRATPG